MRTIAARVATAAALLALAGCGDEETRDLAACGLPAGATVTGPFCLTPSGAEIALEHAGVPSSCRAREARRDELKPRPQTALACRSEAGVAFTLVVYRDPQEALRARPSVRAELGPASDTGVVRLARNLVLLIDQETERAVAVRRAVERLGESAG